MIKILFCVAFGMIISACSPSQAAVQTAIAQTMAANPTAIPTSTETPSPVPTDTPTPTPTSTITPTQTPTPTFTPTPTSDVRIIDIDPQKFLLKQEDFPKEGLYYLPGPRWIGKNTNDMIITAWGVERGREYVIATGRIWTWWVWHARGTLSARMPEEIESEIALYRTAAGAQLSLKKYNNAETNSLEGWKYIDRKMNLGDDNITIASYEIDAGGQKNTYYMVEFTYRNVLVRIYGWAYKEEDLPPDLLENLGRIVLKKLQDAPLTNPEDAVLAK